jgi:hypothetical protein
MLGKGRGESPSNEVHENYAGRLAQLFYPSKAVRKNVARCQPSMYL